MYEVSLDSESNSLSDLLDYFSNKCAEADLSAVCYFNKTANKSASAHLFEK